MGTLRLGMKSKFHSCIKFLLIHWEDKRSKYHNFGCLPIKFERKLHTKDDTPIGMNINPPHFSNIQKFHLDNRQEVDKAFYYYCTLMKKILKNKFKVRINENILKNKFKVRINEKILKKNFKEKKKKKDSKQKRIIHSLFIRKFICN